MLSQPLLSILIPTKNREIYATKVVEQILKIKDSELQVVVQNNSDTNMLQSELSLFSKDKRLKYIYHQELLSFVDNFSLGLNNCNGEYILIIGDDDGVNPLIMSVIRMMKQKNIEALTPSLPLVYYWPNSGIDGTSNQGMIKAQNYSSKIKVSHPRVELKKLLRNGCQNYLSFALAKVYHGIIKKSVLEKIKIQTGKYIGGLSPDIYLSVSCSLLVERVVNIDYPITISGICKSSGSADSATGRHTGEITSAPHFRGHINYKWSEKIPNFYSVETIWADSALAAIYDLNAVSMMHYFNLNVLSAICKKLYPKYLEIVLKNLVRNSKISKESKGSVKIKFRLLMGIITGPFKIRLKAIIAHIFNKKEQTTFNNIGDIQIAAETVLKDLEHGCKKLLENFELNQLS